MITHPTLETGLSLINQVHSLAFDKNFSFFVNFDSESTDLASSEDQFVEEIFDQIILDIFNASVANW